MRSLSRTTSSNSEEMNTTATPSRGELGHARLDVELRRDVDPARRLVEDEHAGSGGEPAGQQDLLLGTAGEVLDGSVRRGGGCECLDVRLDDRLALAAGDRPRPAAQGLQRQHDVVAHAQLLDDALIAAILAREGDPVAQPGGGGRDRGRIPSIQSRPESGRCAPLMSDGELACDRNRAGRRGRRSHLDAARCRSAPTRRGVRVRLHDTLARRTARGWCACRCGPERREARRCPCRSSSRSGRRDRVRRVRYSPSPRPLRSTVMRSLIA